jgi:hypothetical protein
MPEKQALLAQQISIFLARGGWSKGAIVASWVP